MPLTMWDRETTNGVFLVAVGIAVLVVALAFPHPADSVVVVEATPVAEDSLEGRPTVAYESLSDPVQRTFDRSLDEHGTDLTKYGSYAAYRALDDGDVICKGGECYELAVDGGDTGGNLLFGGFFGFGLAVAAGFALYAGLAWLTSPFRDLTVMLLVLPLAAVGSLLVRNAVALPALRELSLGVVTSFGLAATVPVLVGIGVRLRRSPGRLLQVALVAVAVTLAAAVAGWFADAGLVVIVAVVLFALPGPAIGDVLGRYSVEAAD